jgi:hypothetical protein
LAICVSKLPSSVSFQKVPSLLYFRASSIYNHYTIIEKPL